MLQDPTEQTQQQQLNLDDALFVNTNASRIHDEWRAKFLAGAAEHGGIGKPSLVERKGLIREALCEQYDGISYILAIERRLMTAKAKLRILFNPDSNLSLVQTRLINEVIDLLS